MFLVSSISSSNIMAKKTNLNFWTKNLRKPISGSKVSRF